MNSVMINLVSFKDFFRLEFKEKLLVNGIPVSYVLTLTIYMWQNSISKDTF